MTKIPLAASDRRRRALREPDVLMRNRFVEQNPVLNDGPSYPARPGLRYWKQINGGTGPIRGVFQQPGAFDDDLFAVAYNSLFRIDRITGAATLITNQLSGGEQGVVRMTATGDVGTIGPRLYIADGRALLCYMENGFATGRLNFSVQAADGDVIRLGSTYYRMTNAGALDAGAPAGTLANPWRVLIGPASIIQSLTNLYNAINASGVPGTDYSTALVTPNADAMGTDAVATDLYVRALADGAFGNAVVTTETGANMSWVQGGTLTNGGTPGVIQIVTPDEVGVIDVAMINSFVIVIPAQGEGINGRFYWIEPGETVIDPLNFATAERSADPIYQCVVFNDSFWLPGQNSNEVWYMTGNLAAPVLRQQGIVFDRGVIPGGALQVKDSMVLISPDGSVIQIQGGQKVISTPDIAERLRKAINYSNVYNSL